MRREPPAYQNCKLSAGTVVQVELLAAFRFGPPEKVFGPNSTERMAQEDAAPEAILAFEPTPSRFKSR